MCQKGLCSSCVAFEHPRLICRACADRGATLGFEYKSAASFGGWPLIHICAGADAATLRPKVARGVIAVGNVAVGGLAIGGVSLGLVAVGGGSLGLLFALGGIAAGLGLSVGGLAVGSVAIGGLAVGFSVAMGGAAFAPAVINEGVCDEAARDLLLRWLGPSGLPSHCR